MKLKNIAVASAFVAGNLATVYVNAQASYTVTDSVSSTSYTLSYIQGRYDANTTLLQSQPWWGDAALAGRLMDAHRNEQNSSNPFVLAAYGIQTYNGTDYVSIQYPKSNAGGPNYTTTVSSQYGAWYIENCPRSCPMTSGNQYYLVALGYTASSVNLVPNAYALRSVYNIQSAALNAGLSYDCNVFDKEGFCLSTGGRYSTTNSPETNTTSALLIGSYKYDKSIRLGAWVDQNLATANTNGIKLSNSEPLFGFFGAWTERNDGLGYEVKVSAGYGDKDVAIARTSSVEGSSKLSSRGIQTVSSYGIALDSDWIVAPYVGVKYVSIKRGSYTEVGSGALTYDNLRQESTSVIAGVKFTGKIDPQTFTVLSAGVEQDLNNNVGQYSAGSSNTTAFNSNVQKTRPVLTAGVFYDIDKTQRVGLNATHRQEAFDSTTSTSALATYTVGF